MEIGTQLANCYVLRDDLGLKELHLEQLVAESVQLCSNKTQNWGRFGEMLEMKMDKQEISKRMSELSALTALLVTRAE